MRRRGKFHGTRESGHPQQCIVSVAFFYRFRHQGKLKDLSCGSWPNDSLAAIRSTRDTAKTKLAEGLEPGEEKKVRKIERQREIQKTLDEVARMKHRPHDNLLVLAQGKSGAWTPHDLRRTGATMMQALGVSLDVIDRSQNRVLAGSKIRRHYMHHDYAVKNELPGRCWESGSPRF